MNFPFLELIFCRAFDSDVHALRPHKGQQLVAILAHSCARFPCYLDNQCKDPMDNNKDCRVGQLTTEMSSLFLLLWLKPCNWPDISLDWCVHRLLMRGHHLAWSGTEVARCAFVGVVQMSLDVVLQVGLLSKFVRANTADKHFLFLGDACYNTDILFNLGTEKSIRGSQRPLTVNFGQ